MLRRFLNWRFLSVLALAAVLVPFILSGALQALATGSNKVEDWLPQGFEESRKL